MTDTTIRQPSMGLSSLRPMVKAGILGTLRLAFRLVDSVKARRSIVVYYGWPDFARKAEGLAALLRQKGFPVVVRSGMSFLTRARIKYSPDLHIGFWNHYYTTYLPQRYIFFNAEPLSIPRWGSDPDWLAGMRGALEVWGYAANHEKYVTPLGVGYRHVPFGYTPYYESVYQAHTAGKNLPQDIDVLFVGHVTERRKAMIERIEQAGVKVRTVTYAAPLRGEALDEAFARAKIVLSIFAIDDPDAQVVDLARLDHLLSNRRFVLHERPSAAGRDEEFERYVPTYTPDEIPERCAYFVTHDRERQQIADAAYEWFKANRSLDAALPYDEIGRLLA